MKEQTLIVYSTSIYNLKVPNSCLFGSEIWNVRIIYKSIIKVYFTVWINVFILGVSAELQRTIDRNFAQHVSA